MDITLRKTNGFNSLWIIGGLALIWNAYGVVQFAGSVTATQESLLAQGLTAEQAAVMTGYPTWMTIVFAVGVFGGLAGSVLLLMRKALAVPVFAASLTGYVALYAGDIVHGVFAAMGAPQVIILSIVVGIAAGLSWVSHRFQKAGQLT